MSFQPQELVGASGSSLKRRESSTTPQTTTLNQRSHPRTEIDQAVQFVENIKKGTDRG
eukprot:m.504282 g.504282  ORF g.504282 m.504282 type:complete len:58 (-) comp242181_c0_seq1:16-189(-)